MPANGIYGTRIPSIVNENDVDIFYAYSPTRSTDDVSNMKFTKLNSGLLSQSVLDESSKTSYDYVLEGMYNLKLPVQYFNKKGFYTVYIKPKEIPAVLLDVGVLSSYPDVKGLIIDTTTLENQYIATKFRTNNALCGYRVIYFDDNYQREDYYRLVTSNNRCEPVVQNLTDVNQKAIRYRYNESSNLTFITVTPSSAPTYKPNTEPYIGNATKKVAFVNTLFEPIMLEIEMVDHDIDTLSTMVEGSQLRNLDNGLVTTFNENNEIYHQSEHYSLKSTETSTPMYEVKINKNNSIDFTQTLEDKI